MATIGMSKAKVNFFDITKPVQRKSNEEYVEEALAKKMIPPGLDPGTSSVLRMRHNQLDYGTVRGGLTRLIYWELWQVWTYFPYQCSYAVTIPCMATYSTQFGKYEYVLNLIAPLVIAFRE